MQVNILNEEIRLNLITGEFTVEEANDVLLDLFRHKIRFHERKLFADYEEFGEDQSNSQGRIEALRMEMELLRDLMAKAKARGAVLKVDCPVKITTKLPAPTA